MTQAPEPEWITRVQAAEILGCSSPTVGKLADQGRLVRRKAPTVFPSILASSVRGLAIEREAERQAREEKRAERAKTWTPPPDGKVWLDARTAAAVLGLTRPGCTNGRMPAALPSPGTAGRCGSGDPTSKSGQQ